MLNEGKSVAFDCDGTLKALNDDSPRYDVIDLLLKFQALGFAVCVWSGSGVSYAESVVRRLGLKNVEVVAKGSFLPDIAFDDAEGCALGKVTVRV